jgi:DedD protein
MERRLKERLIGASVLVMLAVIFIPIVLDDSAHAPTAITVTNIPPIPDPGHAPPPRPEPVAAGTGSSEQDAAILRVPEIRKPEPEPETAAATPEKAADPGVSRAASPYKPAAKTSPVGLSAWVVQLGSFDSAENAGVLNNRLRQAGYASFVEPFRQNGVERFRVRVGPELQQSDAQALRDRLKAGMGLDGIVMRYP